MKSKIKIWLPLLLIVSISMAFLIYTHQYYRADETAKQALDSCSSVHIDNTDFGWYFDGPAEDSALIFYPGGKVEETAYAPLLSSLAENGIDVFLVKMPFRLAVFGINKASSIMQKYSYENWYIGGHSLGGSMAASYASEHSEDLKGLIMLAAYPVKELNDSLLAVTIYGSEDTVLNMDKLKEGSQFLPSHHTEYVIKGGNHAQFGNYGIQNGDGTAVIPPAEQQRQTVIAIIEAIES